MPRSERLAAPRRCGRSAGLAADAWLPPHGWTRSLYGANPWFRQPSGWLRTRDGCLRSQDEQHLAFARGAAGEPDRLDVFGKGLPSSDLAPQIVGQPALG